MAYLAYFDGACEPRNPGGHGGWGFVIYDPAGAELATGSGVLPAGRNMTNNVAEYQAALETLRSWAQLGEGQPLLIRGDSKLVVEQMAGRWRVNAGAYVPVHHQARELVVTHKLKVRWEWVRREHNRRADALSKQELGRLLRPSRATM